MCELCIYYKCTSEQTRKQNAIFTHPTSRREKKTTTFGVHQKNSLLKWYSPFCLLFFHSLFICAAIFVPFVGCTCVMCVCVSFFGPFIQWRKISHLAFKVVNVCQNELAFKIYIFMGFTTSSLPFFAYALLLSSFSKCVWLCVCMKVYVWVCTLHVCPMLPSFSLHSENFGGLFNMNIFVWVPECVCICFCGSILFFAQWCVCSVFSVQYA